MTYNVTLYQAQFEVITSIINNTIAYSSEESIANLYTKYPKLKDDPLVKGILSNVEGLLSGLQPLYASCIDYCNFLVGSLLPFADTYGKGYNLALLVLMFYTYADEFKVHFNKTPNVAVIYELAKGNHLVICNKSSCTKIVN